jgi:hypothetical protein
MSVLYIALLSAFASGWLFAKIERAKRRPFEKHFLEM